MEFDYIVSLKNDRAKYINILSQLLCLISCIFFILQQTRIGTPKYVFIAIVTVIILGLFYNYYIAVKKGRFPAYGRLIALCGFTWLAMPFLQWLIVPFILLALIEKHAKSPLEIGIATDRVVFNSLIKRTFEWNQLSNMLLKDDLLTIDFKNNRLFQKEMVDGTSDIVEAEFNEYCRSHLSKP